MTTPMDDDAEADRRLREIVEKYKRHYGKDGLLFVLSQIRRELPSNWVKEYGSADAWPYPAGPYDSIEDLERTLAEGRVDGTEPAQ